MVAHAGRSLLSAFFLTSVFLATAFAFVPGAAAQGDTCANPNVGCCGDLDLILLNPDLQPGSDGFIRASGNSFVQFQAIGAAADQIETFGFSFGVQTTQFPDDVCQAPLWVTGQQVLNYRADTDPSDGFFINLQTGLVPDGQYTAAVHAYDAGDQELARFWASAVVSNCDTAVDPLGQVERCGDDAEQMQRNDATQPWPIVLPGDGLTPADVNGFTVEFAEPLADLRVTLNGEDVTDRLSEWSGREWDNDYLPGYGPMGLSTLLVPECSQQPPQDCTTLGVAYEWTERQLTEDDVLRVEATDLAGNVATKDIHVGSGVTGGAISAEIPILTWSVDVARLEVAPGDSVLFRFTISNSGGATGHPFADQVIPAGWAVEWTPPHVPVPSGSSEPQELLVKVPANATTGTYDVEAIMNYDQAGEQKQLTQILKVIVSGDLAEANQQAEEEAAAAAGEKKDSPAPAFAALGLLGAAVALRRRA